MRLRIKDLWFLGENLGPGAQDGEDFSPCVPHQVST